jgi:predicted DNA-binding transcriptional regulator AlpA
MQSKASMPKMARPLEILRHELKCPAPEIGGNQTLGFNGLRKTDGLSHSVTGRASSARYHLFLKPARTKLSLRYQPSRFVEPTLTEDKIQPPTLAFSIPELAKSVGVSNKHLRNLCDRGEGPAIVRLGHRVVVLAEDAAAWLQERKAASRAIKAA